jgi:WD40 repeat protein
VDRTASDAKAIFIAALDREPGAERAAYLDAACGDRAGLRRRVEALLAAHDRADDVLGPDRGPASAASVAMTHGRGAGPELEPTEAAAPRGPSLDPTVAHGPAAAHPGRPDGHGHGLALSRGTPVRYFGDYEINGELGRGGMGIVYRARQVTLNRPVALKMVRPNVLDDDDDLRRFQNEAEAVALLDHPGIVPVYEIGEHNGRRYFSMKLIEGGSLLGALATYRDDPRTAARLVAEAAEAVAHAHMRGILHRDLKPANILIDAEGRAHVTDFGLAKRLDEDVELTQSGAILGTPAYMSPEQTAGRRGTITTATDVYGLGAVLYALLAGKAPFGGEDVMDTLRAVREQRPEPPTRFNARVPRDLQTIGLKCLEKDPRRRYPTAQALADDLRAWLEHRPIVARRVGPVERAWLWSRRRPALAGLVAMLMISFLGATVLTIAYARQQAERARSELLLREEATRERDRSALLREEAIRERDRNARQAYIGNINLAWREWQDANPARVRDLLRATRPADESAPDFRGFEWFYVDRLGRTPLWTYAAKESIGSSLAFDPGGAWVAVTMEGRDGKAGEIVLLDTRTGKEIRRIASRRARFVAIAVSPDGRRLASAEADGAIVLHDTASGEERERLPAPAAGVTGEGCVTFSRDGRRLARLMSTSGQGQPQSVVDLWDVPAKRMLRSLSIPMYVFRVAFSPDGTRLATASSALTIWDTSTGNVEREVHRGEIITDVAYSPDGRTLAGASFTGWIGSWDPATGTRGKTLAGHRGEIHRIGFSPDGRRLVSAGLDRVIRIWDVATDGLPLELRGHESQIWDVGFAPDGHRVASVGFHDGSVRFWDAERGQESIALKDDRPAAAGVPAFGLAFSADGRVLLATQFAGALQAWDPALGTSPYRIDAVARNGRGWVAVAPASDVLATLDDRRSIVLRKTSTGETIRALDASEGSRIGVFSPDGRSLVAGVEGGPIGIWEVATGRRIATLEGHTQPVECLAFSPDGGTIASGSFDTTVRIWDFASRKEVMVYRGHSAAIASVAFQPDGQGLASAPIASTVPGEVRLWDIKTGRDSKVIRGHVGFVRRLSYLPDGRRLVSLGDDGVLKLWDTASGQETLSIAAHSRNGLGLAVSPDGRRLATSGAEGAIRIWDSGTR